MTKSILYAKMSSKHTFHILKHIWSLKHKTITNSLKGVKQNQKIERSMLLFQRNKNKAGDFAG